MPTIQPYHDFFPQIASDAFIAENATLIGDLIIGAKSSIWFQAVLRGDAGPIRIGEATNIQDGCMIHGSTGRTPTIIGNSVIVGHRAIIHGCTIENEVLIGMGAIVLDEAVVPTHTIVAAGALVPERKQLESGYLYAGIPAKKIKPISAEQILQIKEAAQHYVEKGQWYKEFSKSMRGDI